MDNVIKIKDDFRNIKDLFLSAQYSERDIDIQNGQNDGMHIHDCFEIYMNIVGDVSFAVENNIYKISSGDMVVTKPNEFHYCIFEKNIKHKCHCIWFNLEKDSELAKEIINKIANGNNLIKVNEENKDFRVSLFKKIYEDEGIGRYSAFFLILDEIINEKSNLEKSRLHVPESIKEIIDYINSNFQSITSLDDIYKRFGISASTLNREFHCYIKVTPAKYIESIRLANAKKIIMQGESVMKAYMESGFPDYSHFIKLFKDKFGETPGKYYKK